MADPNMTFEQSVALADEVCELLISKTSGPEDGFRTLALVTATLAEAHGVDLKNYFETILSMVDVLTATRLSAPTNESEPV